MSMGIMTISVETKTEQRFRKAVKTHLGTGKGKLGAAVSEAMEKWVQEKEQQRIGQKGLDILRKGFNMGKWKWTSRDELHERH